MYEKHSSRIVVAEDDRPSLALLVRQLTKAGYEVSACENGRVALDAIREQGACIVIADWSMPEMDGAELCRAVRGLCDMNVLTFVYYILLTAHTSRDEIVAGFESGADDYLTKPYHREELLARIRAGERIHTLQTELVSRQFELRKANAQLESLNNQLETLANTDVLTQVANRRCLFERFRESWSFCERKNQPLSCIMFDIDKFKSINDTYGHAAGDYVLKNLAEHAQSCLRRYDVLGRVGGEEFCVLCPGTDVEGVSTLAERIRSRIQATAYRFEGKTIPVTVSLGVAARSEQHTSPESMISEADAMLYRAKENGRNQVWRLNSEGNPERLIEHVAIA